jgi:sugar phosphate isomerase/epimerase
MMPFTRGNVNFVEVIKALREVGYDGVFNLEIPGESQIPLELRDAKLSFIKTFLAFGKILKSPLIHSRFC